jgi:hypothetical protein
LSPSGQPRGQPADDFDELRDRARDVRKGFVLEIGKCLRATIVAVDHLACLLLSGALTDPRVALAGAASPRTEGRARVVEAKLLHIRLLVLEQNGARDAHCLQVVAKPRRKPLGFTAKDVERRREHRLLVVGFALMLVPRFEHSHQPTIRDEVLRCTSLSAEARERAVVEVGVLPAKCEQTSLSLPRVEGDGVQHAPSEGDDRFAVGVRPAQERQRFGREKERVELVGIHFGTQVLPNGIGSLKPESAREFGKFKQPVQTIVLLDARFRSVVGRLCAHYLRNVVGRDCRDVEVTERRTALSTRLNLVCVRLETPAVDRRTRFDAKLVHLAKALEHFTARP